ncbi:MAG: hypothetical protein ACYDG6_06650 [Thermincolia bacterium]
MRRSFDSGGVRTWSAWQKMWHSGSYNHGRLVGQITVSGSAVTSVQFTGLDGNAHGGYVLVAEAKAIGGSGASVLNLFINGDNTATNYRSQELWASGASLGAVRHESPRFLALEANDGVVAVVDINRTPTHWYCLSATKKTDPQGLPEIRNYSISRWTAANITQLNIVSTLAGGIDLGSKFSLYRRM